MSIYISIPLNQYNQTTQNPAFCKGNYSTRPYVTMLIVIKMLMPPRSYTNSTTNTIVRTRVGFRLSGSLSPYR